MNYNPLLLTDFYKIGHPFQYPPNTTCVYSNLTPRKSRLEGVEKMTFFGLQYFLKEYLIDQFNTNFFQKNKTEVISEYKRVIKNTIGELASYHHIEELWDLGYLPIEIKALPEGVEVDMKIPVMTIVNTLPNFYWLTNFIETLLTSSTWQAFTSASIAREYHKTLSYYAQETGMPQEFVAWQGHDFSFRGMSSLESAILSAMGHLIFFTGTDTIPAILSLEKYYNADCTNELIGASVNASEHSVMCSGSKENELETYRRLLTEVYPNGILSLVSDTWDLWKVCIEYMQELKDVIINRDGKLVIRPDSGDPVDIICGLEVFNWTATQDISGLIESIKGDVNLEPQEYLIRITNDFNNDILYHKIRLTKNLNYHNIISEHILNYAPTPSELGVVEILWNVFGGTITNKGYRLLDSHIGVIYGDSITRERAKHISERLMRKGFASQVVFGIGSYTYQYNTRDTFGIAVKSTYVEINGKGENIFKDPITDDGTKKSAKGLLKVEKIGNKYVLIDNCEITDMGGELQTVFKNGKIIKEYSLAEVRKNAMN